MKNRDGLENSDHWITPKWLYDILDEEFHFDFDPCPANHDLRLWDGLEVEWGKSNYCNPPYNRVDKPKFIQKAFQQYTQAYDKKVCLLIPAATGTKMFHHLIVPNCQDIVLWSEWYGSRKFYRQTNLVIFMEGRIAFEGYNTKGEYTTKNKGKHDSMLIFLR